MMVFENEIAKIVDLLPALTDQAGNSFAIKFQYGNQADLAEYLTKAGKQSFPLIWLVNSEDVHSEEGEKLVTRNNAQLIFLSETQVTAEMNPYQWMNDFDKILQPIVDNFIKVMQNSVRGEFDFTEFTSQRVPRYHMGTQQKDLVYICNAITLSANITFYYNRCLRTNIFKNGN